MRREPSGRPTLVVFTRGAERETRHRRLLPARLAPLELALHRRCLDVVLAAGRAAGCALVVSSPAETAGGADAATPGVRWLGQRGRRFGDRLQSALAQARGDGAGSLLVVGTDTPGITRRHLRAAIGTLDRDPASVVLGPAPDGGIYLLATRRPLDDVLARVAWRRRDTLASLLAALAEAGIPVILLEPLADLDRPQDLARWVRVASGEAWRWLVGRVREALAALGRLAVPPVLGRPRRPAPALPGGRGPPTAL